MSLSQPHPADFQLDSVEQSQSMTVADRFWAGAELFEYACTISRSGIRRQHPEYSSEEVEAELRRRVDLQRQREDRTSERD